MIFIIWWNWNIINCINRIVTKLETIKEDELSNKAKTSLNVDLLYLKYLLGINVTKQLSKKLNDYRVDDKDKISTLEKNFNRFLNKNLINLNINTSK